MDHRTSAENWSNIAAACFRFPSFFLFLRFHVFDSNTFSSPLHLDVEDEDVVANVGNIGTAGCLKHKLSVLDDGEGEEVEEHVTDNGRV